MRFITALTAIAVAGALTASLAGPLAPADAAVTVSHVAAARADWTKGAHEPRAVRGRYWSAARTQLAAYGTRDDHERSDLSVLIRTPETDTTAAQRATATRVTRELNGFFLTPDLYRVTDAHPVRTARADWVTSAHVARATHDYWLAAAVDELSAYGRRYAVKRAELVSLEAIPLTNATAKQRATARRDARALDTFFHTPGLND